MRPQPRNYGTRELPWHAFQRLLAEELKEQTRERRTDLPLHSWLARALAESTAAPHRC